MALWAGPVSGVWLSCRREGLVKSPEMQLKAGKEYHRKTTGPHQMWATDASYFKVIGWGYYYMVTVMDDYSRFIIAHKLQRDMTSDSFIEVVQDAVDRTGMTEVPGGRQNQVAERQRLWLRVPSLWRLPQAGRHQAHLLDSPRDQRVDVDGLQLQGGASRLGPGQRQQAVGEPD